MDENVYLEQEEETTAPDETEEEMEDPAEEEDTKSEKDDEPEEEPRLTRKELEAAVRQARRETEMQLRAAYDEEIAGSGAVNPYTGQAFRSFRDFKEYASRYKEEMLAELAQKTGLPVDQLREEAANQAYLSKQRKKDEGGVSNQTMKDRLLKEALDFQKEFPDVDIGKVEKDAAFRKFAGSRLYKEPIADLYRDYREMMGNAKKAGEASASSKRDRGTGGGGGGESVNLTPSQQRALSEWNRENPGMKMTAKEFLKR